MADKRISQLVDRGTVVNNDVIPIVVSGATTTNKATISSIQTFMQGNLDVGVTSVGITVGSSGTDVNVSGSPVTSSGNITINIPSASATNRGLVTTGAQTIAGAKTFSSDLTVNGITVGKGLASNGNNTAIGATALGSNTTGTLNTAIGIQALAFTTSGNGNTANGANSLVTNTTGGFNTASGSQSLYSNSTGGSNTAIGTNSLYSNTTGTYNTGIGSGAGYYIADGSTPNTTSDFSIYLGADTKASADNAQNEIVIGYNAIGNGSNTVTIGNSSITSNKLFGKVIHADAVNANESATLGQVNTALGGYVTLATTQTITAQKTFTTSGGSDSVIISTTGAGFALDAIKAGNGEVIRVNKTSGTGNAMTVIGGNFEAPTIVKTGGTSAQFLKADGSVDSSTYLTTGTAASTYVPYTGATTSVDLGDNVLTSGGLNIDNLGGFGGALNLRQATSFSTWSGAAFTSIYATPGNNLIINFSNDNRTITLNGALVSAASPRTFTFPDATGTLALTTDLGAYLPLTGGTLTGALNGTEINASMPSGNGALYIKNSSLTSKNWTFIPSTNAGETDLLFFYTGTGAGTKLTLASTGAATFASSVGVGAAPTGTYGTLSVSGGVSIKNDSSAKLEIGRYSAGVPNSYIKLGPSSNSLRFTNNTDAADLFIIENAGNVGIGTTSPTRRLTVQNAADDGTLQIRMQGLADPTSFCEIGRESMSTGDFRINVARSGVVINALKISDTTGAATFTNKVTARNGTSGVAFETTNAVDADFTIETVAGGTTKIGTSGNKLAINVGGGNVGIGTASPASLLEIAATSPTLRINSTTGGNDGSLAFYVNTNYIGDIRANSGSGAMTINQGPSAAWGGFIVFKTDTTERMRISSGGDIGIGADSNSIVRLLTRGKDTGTSNYAFIAQNSAATNLFLVRNDGLIILSSLVSTFTTGSAANMFVSPGDGAIYRSTSSIKYKKNVEDYDRGLTEVMQMRPVFYEGISESDEGKIFAGLIAEEVHDLGLTEFVQYAEDGSPDSLAYQNMVALLIKAIQELKKEIDSLKNQMQ